MDYHFWFWMLIAFAVGRMTKLKVYVGHDPAKYEAATVGILLRRGGTR
jgi:hypothetical protein